LGALQQSVLTRGEPQVTVLRHDQRALEGLHPRAGGLSRALGRGEALAQRANGALRASTLRERQQHGAKGETHGAERGDDGGVERRHSLT
jgi:hypothetical protein